MEEPPDMARLDAIAGKQWTNTEVRQVHRWWFQRPQMRMVWLAAGRFLGRGARLEDIQDAVMEFFVILEQARLSYEPGGPTFRCYLLNVCFKNACIQMGERIRRQQLAEASLYHETTEGDEEERDLHAPHSAYDPQCQAYYQAVLTELDTLLASGSLPPPQCEAFVLRHYHGYSYEEIAFRMNAPIGSVRGWLHRASRSIRNHFHEGGWSE